ncbi:DUF4139 domain-containing protein [Novosphingobium sp. FSY-8]|uniref:DUF4139 domain-containing protein n=1 Tax=Novosphingobium ovatum TaxID=1908523 RepID=A0ABW9XG01_9SPHN|nr:DUF4139 domain-containing protein [Novosphingobium ovatum]
MAIGFGSGAAQAAARDVPVVATPQGDVAITIYNNDLALIQDRRPLNLSGGISVAEFADVSAQIRPETVTLSVPGAGVVEQNFDYDLLSPERLVDKGVGQDVTIIRTNPGTGAETVERGRILANNNGTLVQIGSRIEVLGDMHARLVFDRLPDGLKARPTLSVRLNAAASGSRPATLSYLSRGFSWKADYVALYDETQGKLDLQGWVTLNNTTGTSFADARLMLVAGSVGEEAQPMRYGPRRPAGVVGTGGGDGEQLGDFHIYPIAGRTTLANAQQKQIAFLDAKAVSAAKTYWYRNAGLGGLDEAASFASVLRFDNAVGGALGNALPAGAVRVYMRDASGQPQFIGEDNIAHTPAGSTLVLKTGDAFDVKIQPVVDKRERIDSAEWERVGQYRITRDGVARQVTVEKTRVFWRTQMRYKLTNARSQPVTVEVVQAGLGGMWNDTRVSAESVPGKQQSLDERVWKVTVPAHGEVSLTAQIDTSF